MLGLKLNHVSKSGPSKETMAQLPVARDALAHTLKINNLQTEPLWCWNYRKTSSISRTESQNLNVSCILLQLSSFNPLKLGVKLRMKM